MNKLTKEDKQAIRKIIKKYRNPRIEDRWLAENLLQFLTCPFCLIYLKFQKREILDSSRYIIEPKEDKKGCLRCPISNNMIVGCTKSRYYKNIKKWWLETRRYLWTKDLEMGERYQEVSDKEGQERIKNLKNALNKYADRLQKLLEVGK